jgi:hypothetical protein
VCCYIFSWTSVPSCSATVSAKAACSWTRIFHPAASSIQCPNHFQTPAAGNQSVQRTQATQNPLQGEWKCYASGERGHIANQCPNPRTRPPQMVVFLLLPSRTMFVGRSIMLLWRKPRKLQTWSLVCFFVNDTSTIVLIDSGASHSFISIVYVEKHKLPLALLKCEMIVSSLRGEMPAR